MVHRTPHSPLAIALVLQHAISRCWLAQHGEQLDGEANGPMHTNHVAVLGPVRLELNQSEYLGLLAILLV